MSLSQDLADIGMAAEELGYGIESLTVDKIVLIARQDYARVTMELPVLTGDLLRVYLKAIPHRSSSAYVDWSKR